MKKQLFALFACIVACSAQFHDEMQVYEKECLGEDRFHCLDGGCISREQQCDGNADCSDGSDENFCLNHPPDPSLCNQTHQYLCEDGLKCILSTWLCNNVTDCDDGSDEVNCSEVLPTPKNQTCKGFECGDGTCISRMWVCDAHFDCIDRTDEDPENCRHSSYLGRGEIDCEDRSSLTIETDVRHYSCNDGLHCLNEGSMCNGMQDCRDNSDEGSFCEQWSTMCSNVTCGEPAVCIKTREGPVCFCRDFMFHTYNNKTNTCEPRNMCIEAAPVCSQICLDKGGPHFCFCEPGYRVDVLNVAHLCYAPEPEGMLFFSTRNEIKYLYLKSKQIFTIASGVKEAHGVSYDGTFVYWVETAMGHQSIVRAHLENVADSKQVLVSLGLEDAGDVAVDWMGGHIYFSDSERGVISVCLTDGSMCTTLRTNTRAPKHVTLDPKNGKMYWADWHGKPVIMSAQMDGSQSEVLIDHLHKFPTGLAIDVPGGRLYYVDKTIKGVLIKNKKTFALLHEPIHQPNSLAVFENSVYWSDWTSNTIQISNKILKTPNPHTEPYKLDAPVFGMHIYHPILINTTSNPCANHNCSHFCLIKTNVSYTCACPDGMKIDNTTCKLVEGYRPQYLIVAGGSKFTRIQYNTLGNPETHATHFDVLRVHAMAYDNSRDTLYIYDGRSKSINYVNMSEFSLGITQTLTYLGLEDVVDMGYDYISDDLYVLDAGRRFLEVFSLRTLKRAIIHRFNMETPISMVVLPNYGKILIAVKSDDGLISIDSFGLDGDAERRHVVWNNLKGPRIRLQYSHEMDNVFFSDEGNRVIDFMHVEGTGRETFRELSTTIASLAVTDTYVFWTDRRATRLYWSDIHETTPKIRRLEFSMFPNDTHLHLLTTSPIPDPKSTNHPCRTNICSDICVQSFPTPNTRAFRCLCPPGMLNVAGVCVGLRKCEESEGYCHLSNTCFDEKERCDGKKDCLHGEDEEGCTTIKPSTTTFSPDSCPPNEIICHGVCIDHNQICAPEKSVNTCSETEFECVIDQLCIPRWQICDSKKDCPDGSDEALAMCHTHNCLHSEYMCSSGACILNTFRCDGELDCTDGSDEENCVMKVCSAGFYTCRNSQCIEVHKRCDGNTDCTDSSDEEACDDPDDASNQEEIENCAEWEYACEYNRSICIPLTARCNQKAECPGGTDEVGCIGPCPLPRWLCDHYRCLPGSRICDGTEDCADRSDETPDACKIANRTAHFYPPIIYPREECRDGYLCNNGQCINWKQVCDGTTDCYDGSDENGRCNVSCLHHNCSHRCQPSPNGPICQCQEGYRIDTDYQTCVDTDECEKDACAQACYNIPGSYLCSCHHGYALRADRHSCKATKGHMLVYYISGNSVKSKVAGGFTAVEYNNPQVGRISDMDVDVRRSMLYVTSEEAGRLIQVNSSRHDITVTNVGSPSKVAVDWITGNIYFADSTATAPRIRVCNFGSKRCASLQKLTSGSVVSSLIVDPASRRMFYCATKDLESVVWSATLAGQKVLDIATVYNCTGLAVDSFRKKLYVAETGPAQILQMDYEGNKYKKMFKSDPHLESPHGLAIFEDHIYFLVASSFELNRCVLYGSKECELYLQRIFDANTFVLRHESVQRDDLKNVCEGFNCTNVCVLDENGPICLCNNGNLAKDGNCPPVEKIQLPLFDGWTFQDFIHADSAGSASFVLVCSVMGLFAMYLGVFLYYHIVHRRRQARNRAYLPVLFLRSSASAGSSTQGLSPLTTPSVHMPEQTDDEKHEYTNPLEFLQSAWRRQSFRKDPRPVGTAGLSIEVPSQQTLSDTESDLDEKEQRSSKA